MQLQLLSKKDGFIIGQIKSNRFLITGKQPSSKKCVTTVCTESSNCICT